ncbi:hypothetical protein MRX96_013507 [Rhipicephalus microplus]
MLSRVLEFYGKVHSISTDNLTGLRITIGNRRAHMEFRSPVPNITDVDGHVVRCEYDGFWGHPTCDAPCKRCGEDHPPHLCKQSLYSEETTRTSVPQVEPPTVVSTEVQGAPAPTISDKGEQGEAIQAAPGYSVLEEGQPTAPSPLGGEKAPPTLQLSRGKGGSSCRRKCGGSQARTAAAARDLSTSASESSRSENTSLEYQRHAATAGVDDDSSSTTVEDSEMHARSQAPCDLCKSVACDCSELSDMSAHTPLTSLIDLETGSYVETPDGVLEVAKRFYENLYAEPTPPMAEFPFGKNAQVFELCDSPIVKEELYLALVTRSVIVARAPTV